MKVELVSFRYKLFDRCINPCLRVFLVIFDGISLSTVSPDRRRRKNSSGWGGGGANSLESIIYVWCYVDLIWNFVMASGNFRTMNRHTITMNLMEKK